MEGKDFVEQVTRVTEGSRLLHVQSGRYATVKFVDEQRQYLDLVNQDGKVLRWTFPYLMWEIKYGHIKVVGKEA